ncbi:MAG: hypothetical protein PHN55_08845 [Dysgonamonadaceae bacterium]|nr:hypothetical protein [Dysgonamonadaceae bacterium]
MKNHDERVSLEEHFYNANLEESRRKDEEDYFRKFEEKQTELNLEAFLKSQNDTYLKSLEK